ncbi:hypothetical protein D3C81_965410 [compost metagenome]
MYLDLEELCYTRFGDYNIKMKAKLIDAFNEEFNAILTATKLLNYHFYIDIIADCPYIQIDNGTDYFGLVIFRDEKLILQGFSIYKNDSASNYIVKSYIDIHPEDRISTIEDIQNMFLKLRKLL